MNKTVKNALQGLRVLVTRTKFQSQPLMKAIEAEGGEPILFSTIKIIDPANQEPFLLAMRKLNTTDIIIFVSANAVYSAAPLLNKYWPTIPPHIKILAIGDATKEAIKEHLKVKKIITPHQFNSEILLETPELQQVSGKQVIIFCGEDPRKLLPTTLQQRGAQVIEAFCYRRVVPLIDVAPLLQRLENKSIDIMVSTSRQGLKNLYAMVGEYGRNLLLNVPVLAVSKNVAEIAMELDFKSPAIVIDNIDDQSILQALRTFNSIKGNA